MRHGMIPFSFTPKEYPVRTNVAVVSGSRVPRASDLILTPQMADVPFTLDKKL